MISSLYIIDYFKKLGALLDSESIAYHSDLIHVPGGSASDFMSYLAKKEIINTAREAKAPLLVIGWDKGTTNRMANARIHERIRSDATSPDASAKVRKEIQGQFTLSIFCICNKGNLVEDFEEVYATIIRPRTVFKVDASSVYELAHPDFGANMLHGDISTTCLNSNGNLWGLSWAVNIFGPLVNLAPADRAKCSKLTIALYNNEIKIDDISFNKSGELIAS